MKSGEVLIKKESPGKQEGRIMRFMREKAILRNKQLYFLMIPVILYYAVFCYAPIYGIQLAFKNFNAAKGIAGSPWVGLTHFQRFFTSPYFGRLMGNTIAISLLQLAFGFLVPILLALMVNEVRNKRMQKLVQNITYFPYFLSVVVLVGMLKNFVHPDYGIVNVIISALGGTPVDFIQEAQWFRPLYVISGVWQTAGWNSIIYIAALAGVDVEMHESAKIEGASRLQRLWYINLPSIMPTIMIVLILNVGQMMNIGFEKAFLMQNSLNLATADIISTYVYKIGIQGAQYDYSTAINLFNSVINCILLFTVNTIAKKAGETSLW